jgi:ribosomal protein S3
MEFVIVLAVLAVVVFVVSGPLRKAYRDAAAGGTVAGMGAGAPGWDRTVSGRLDELEAAREAKYREIRDAELDHRTGKLSDADYEAVDRALRAEAIEIMHAIDRAGADAAH